MRRFKSILFVADGSEGEKSVLARAAGLASANSANLSIGAAHQSELDRLLGPHPHDKRTVHLIKGEAKEVIPDLAERLEVDRVVIGTVGRAGVPGLLIGNTAEAILNSVDCSVLTLKPEGFETPIQV